MPVLPRQLSSPAHPALPVQYPKRPIARDEAAEKQLKARTLTQLYNARPQWLSDAHANLDAAVAAAYGWDAAISEEEALARLLKMNAAA